MASGGMLNLIVSAVDKATPNLGKVGKSIGKLQSTAGKVGGALAKVGAAAGAIGVGVGAFAVMATKAAADEEKQVATLNAVLKSRSMLTDENTAAMAKQEARLAGLAISDDAYRASLSKATAFTSKFSDALKIQDAAVQLAAGAGISLEQATAAVGKAYAGTGRGLKAYGIETTKTIGKTKKTLKGQAAVNLVLDKYKGAAEAAANTTSGKFAKAQVAANNLIEKFGANFLPMAADAADFLSTSVLPGVSKALDALAPIIQNVGTTIADTFGPILTKNITNLTRPGGVFDSVLKGVGPIFDGIVAKGADFIATLTGKDGLLTRIGDLAGALWGDGKGPLAKALTFLGAALENAFGIFGNIASFISTIIDLITELVNVMNRFSEKISGDPVLTALASGVSASGPQGTGWGATPAATIPAVAGGATFRDSNGIVITLKSDIPTVVTAVDNAQGAKYKVITDTRNR